MAEFIGSIIAAALFLALSAVLLYAAAYVAALGACAATPAC